MLDGRDPLGLGMNGVVWPVLRDDDALAVKIIRVYTESQKRGSDQNSPRDELDREWRRIRDDADRLASLWIVGIDDCQLVDLQSTEDTATAYGLVLMERWPSNLERYVLDGLTTRPAWQAADLVRAVAETLRNIHAAKDFLFTDMKPRNFLVRALPDGRLRVVIGDIGGLRGAGSVYGTAEQTWDWAAPECMIQDQEPDLLSTIYSFGLVAYFIVEGHLPYLNAESRRTRLALIREGGPDFRDGLPPELKRLVETVRLCLVNDRSKRPQNFDAVLDNLTPGGPQAGTIGRVAGAESRRWRQLAPGRLQFLVTRASRTRIWWHDRSVEGVDGSELIAVGACGEVKLWHGEMLAAPNAAGLLAMGRFEELLVCLNNQPDQGDDLYLRLYCAGAEPKRIRDELAKARKTTPGLPEALVMAIGLGSANSARNFLREALIGATNPWDLLAGAWIWHRVLGDAQEARKILDSIEQNRLGLAILAAYGWKELFGDEATARSRLEAAENDSGLFYSRTRCAQAWLDLFDDADAARRCLTVAAPGRYASSSPSPTSGELCDRAEAWKSLFDDLAAASRCLTAAETDARTPRARARCAVAWGNVFGDVPQVLVRLQAAERDAADLADWLDCANAWWRATNRTDEVRRCLKAASEAARESFRAWLACADAWRRLCNDTKEARICLDAAEQRARDVQDWHDCAVAWQHLFGNDDDVKRCLAAAEGIAADSRQLRICANMWRDLAHDMNSARQCMAAAETKATKFLDRRECTRAWTQSFDDGDAGRQCLKGGSKFALPSWEWREYANEWIFLFSDIDQARRCLKQSEKTAEDSSDLFRCFHVWLDKIKDVGEARRCLTSAVKRSTTASDLRMCARIWITAFADVGTARNCLNAAETKATDTLDWLLCARAWVEELHESDRSRLCLKAAEGWSKYAGELDQCANAWRDLLRDQAESQRCRAKAEHMRRQ